MVIEGTVGLDRLMLEDEVEEVDGKFDEELVLFPKIEPDVELTARKGEEGTLPPEPKEGDDDVGTDAKGDAAPAKDANV